MYIKNYILLNRLKLYNLYRFIVFALTFISSISILNAQNPNFNQSYNVRQLTNLAFIGMGMYDAQRASRIATNIQARWLSLDRRLTTNAIEGDIIANENTSWGINLYSTDLFAGTTGNSSYNHFSAGLNYCYSIKLSNGGIQLALNGQYSNFNFGVENFLWEDQINPTMTGFELPTNEPLAKLSVNAIHFSIGALYSQPNYFIGAALYNINQPNISFYNESNQRIESRVVLQAGLNLGNSRFNIIPSINAYLQGGLVSISEDINFRKGNIYYGFGLKQNSMENQISHSVMGNFGYRKGNWFFNYSNNTNLSLRVANNPMIHEIGITYLLPSRFSSIHSVKLPLE